MNAVYLSAMHMKIESRTAFIILRFNVMPDKVLCISCYKGGGLARCEGNNALPSDGTGSARA